MNINKLKLWRKKTWNLMEKEVAVLAGRFNVSADLSVHLNHFVELYYDVSSHIVALKPIDEKGNDTYSVSNRAEIPGRDEMTKWIQVKSIIKELKIKKGKYPATWLPKKGMIVFEYQKKDGSDEKI